MPVTPQTPGVADHAAPDPTAQVTPEPLVSAEAVRSVILAVIAAGAFGGTQIPDEVLAIVVPVATTVIGVAASWALTWVARGKVWALRSGVDIDRVIDEVQRRTT